MAASVGKVARSTPTASTTSALRETFLRNAIMRKAVRAALAVMALGAVQAGTCLGHDGGSNQKLSGKYSVLIQEDCVYSASGFGSAPLFEALGPVTRGTATIQGVATLSKDGTGEIVARYAHIGTNPAITPALGMTATCPLTYTIDPDRAFTATYNCTGTTVLGTGARIALENFQNGMQVTGHAHGRKSVLAASTALAIENVGSLAAPPVPRMCHRTFQLMSINPGAAD
jgi:hypothetical protein